MSEWRTLKISDVAEVIGGGTPSSKREDYYGGHISWLTPKDLSGYSDKYISGGERSITEDGLKNSSAKILPKDSVLITSRAPIGYVAIASKPLATNQGFKSLILKSDYDPNFFYYLIKSNIAKLEAVSSGSTFKEISGSVLKAVEFDIPDSETQKAISSLLNPLDDKIALNRKLNATLEAMAQALFQSWFVDFDPVKAKLAAVRCGRDPEQAAMAAIACKLVVPPGKPKADNLDEKLPSAEAIDAAIAALAELSEAQRQSLKEKAAHFPADFQESELGLIPLGWEVSEFQDMLSSQIGGDWGKEEPDDKHTIQSSIIRGTDIPDLRLGCNIRVPKRWVDIKKLESRKLQFGDIVIEISGGSPKQSTGRSIRINQSILEQLGGISEPASFCRLFRPLDLHKGLMVSLHLKHIYDAGKMWSYQNQSTGIANFQTKRFLKEELLAIPSNYLLGCFYNIVAPLIDSRLNKQSRTLADLRDALLPKLLSGEISVNLN